MTPKEEVESLMNEGIGLARLLLSKHGEFFPFGYVMQKHGEIRSVATYDGNEHPPSQELIDLLMAHYRSGAESGEIKATALFMDVRVATDDGTKIDAVQVALEHQQGYCVDVFFPYSIDQDSEVEFGEVFASQREGVVFAQ